MIDTLATLLVLCVIVAVGCLVFVLVAVLPFVVTVDLAERRGFSPTRWGAAALAGTVLMAGTIYWLVTADHPRPLLIPALALDVVAPAVLAMLDRAPRRWAGRVGAHQR